MALMRAGLERGVSERTSILIGSEVAGQGMKEVSIVTSPYRVGDERAGMIGVLGPRRMPYSRLLSIVDYTSGLLSRLLTRLAG